MRVLVVEDEAMLSRVVAESAAGIARTLLTLHADRGVPIEPAVAPDHVVRARPDDVDEMLGNLLDNACKWARTRVCLRSIRDNGSIVIIADDDGSGLEPSMREVVRQRGVRGDEAPPGSGLGLAIVRELAELYGGTILLAESPLGGVRAELRPPGLKADLTGEQTMR